MADTTVTIKLDPKDYDLVRESVKHYQNYIFEEAKDRDMSPKKRQQMRAKAVLLSDLKKRIG